MSNPGCVACGQEAQNFLCWTCTRELKKKLDLAAWLAKELVITFSRQDRTTSPGQRVRGEGETPMPYNPIAGDIIWALHNTLATWARIVCESRGIDYPGQDNTPAVAHWLSDNAVSIAASDYAAECFDEIDTIVKAARRTINNPPGRLYLGPCGERRYNHESPCVEDLYAKRDDDKVICPQCHTEYSVQARRDENDELVRNGLYTAREIERDAGVKISWFRVRVSRGQIPVKHVDLATGEKKYRLGDVLDQWMRFQETRQKRSA